MATFEPIGFVRSPFKEKRAAPRQGALSSVEGTIELVRASGMEHAICDLEGFDRLFVIFHFHEAKHFRPKVQPPRSTVRRGVLATRSPHRPNPIGLSVVRLLGVSGLVLRIAEFDMLDGTPVLDIKPYIPYADAFPNARSGWLDEEAQRAIAPETAASRDPLPAFEVAFAPKVESALEWLATHGADLRSAITSALALGPAPHAYRRIRKKNDHLEIALKDFRAAFTVSARVITIIDVYSGYSARDAPALHRAFANR